MKELKTNISKMQKLALDNNYLEKFLMMKKEKNLNFEK